MHGVYETDTGRDIVSREIVCTECGANRDSEEGNCVECGSKDITIKIKVSDSINIRISESVKGKVREKGSRRPIKEFKHGDDFNRNLNKYVDRSMIIDRKDDLYFELIKDKQSGKTLHKCVEPLSKHQGHGNAKPMQCTSSLQYRSNNWLKVHGKTMRRRSFRIKSSILK